MPLIFSFSSYKRDLVHNNYCKIPLSAKAQVQIATAALITTQK